jgi:hypothetical protein
MSRGLERGTNLLAIGISYFHFKVISTSGHSLTIFISGLDSELARLGVE